MNKGIFIGAAVTFGAVMLVPGVAAALGRTGKPLARAAVRTGAVAYDEFRTAAAECYEHIEDILAEVREEMAEERSSEMHEATAGPKARATEAMATGDAGSSAPYRVHVAHISGRRLRLRLESPPIAREVSQALADRLVSVPGVAHVVVRPNTGSLILETLDDASGVLEELKSEAWLKMVAGPTPPPLGQVLQMGLLRADAGLGQGTGGALDLRTALALVLVVAAVIQLSRGKIAGPATTLLMSAFALMDKGLPPAPGTARRPRSSAS